MATALKGRPNTGAAKAHRQTVESTPKDVARFLQDALGQKLKHRSRAAASGGLLHLSATRRGRELTRCPSMVRRNEPGFG
jgi:hypothetical protein